FPREHGMGRVARAIQMAKRRIQADLRPPLEGRVRHKQNPPFLAPRRKALVGRLTPVLEWSGHARLPQSLIQAPEPVYQATVSQPLSARRVRPPVSWC